MTVQYAFIGLHIPRKRPANTIVKTTRNPIMNHNTPRNFFESTIRSRNRQIDIFMSPSVMNV